MTTLVVCGKNIVDFYRNDHKVYIMIVIHYIPSIDQNFGGVSSYLQLLAHSLGKMVDLHIVTHHSDKELCLDNCTIHYMECGQLQWFKAKRLFCRLLDEIKPDIVHVNSCWAPLCSFTVFWAKKRGIPTVVSPHGMLEPWVLAKNHWTKKVPALVMYQRRALRKADALVATAYSEKDNLLKLNYNNKVEVVPNGVIVDGIEIKKTWKRTRSLLYMGLLRPNKGAGVLIDALSLIKEKLIGYKVIIAGPDTEGYLSTLKRMCNSYGLNDIVSFPGGIFGKEKWTLMQHADFFILPTLNENFGIVIAEAYLSGTPVITCKGAPWACIDEQSIGWWVERTPEKVAQAIGEALDCSEQTMEEKGRRGREYVIQHFSSDKVARVMMEKYEKVINTVLHNKS